MKIITIDPGAGGGIAWSDLNETTTGCMPMPEGMSAQVEALQSLDRGYKGMSKCVIERTGTYVPGNSATAAVKFARHCGHLEAALYCIGIPTTQVAPGVWQKALGALPSDKAERKRAIKELMARRYPQLNVTLKTADALGILTWAIERKA